MRKTERPMRKCVSQEQTEEWVGKDEKGWEKKHLGENGDMRHGKRETKKREVAEKGKI